VLSTDCWGCRICLCVIEKFICESSVLGKDRLQAFRICLCLNVIFICEGSVCGEDRLQVI
jgi:hypothetical protein